MRQCCIGVLVGFTHEALRIVSTEKPVLLECSRLGLGEFERRTSELLELIEISESDIRKCRGHLQLIHELDRTSFAQRR